MSGGGCEKSDMDRENKVRHKRTALEYEVNHGKLKASSDSSQAEDPTFSGH